MIRTELAMPHLREVDEAPRDGSWKIACRCGWAESELVRDHDSVTSIHAALEKRFRHHLPLAERQIALLVDRRPARFPNEEGEYPAIGNFIMPEGVPTVLAGWYESEGIYYGRTPSGQQFPIWEIRTEDGRVFKAE